MVTPPNCNRREEFLIASIGARIRVLYSRDGNRIEVAAPADVQVIRDGTAHDGQATHDRHSLRNRLNKIMLGLFRYRQLVQVGGLDEANAVFERLLTAVDQLDREISLFVRAP